MTRKPGSRDLVLTPSGVRYAGRLWPCAIGRGGVRRFKTEGDGATPTGTHRLTAILYRADRIAKPNPSAWPIAPSDLWCDSSGHPCYNRLVRAPFLPSHERLMRADPLYDLILVTDWNEDGVPNRGSAIFIHQWRRPKWPTAGCIALARGDLWAIATSLQPGARLVVPENLASRRIGPQARRNSGQI